jgi:hypothetical protein
MYIIKDAITVVRVNLATKAQRRSHIEILKNCTRIFATRKTYQNIKIAVVCGVPSKLLSSTWF